MKELSIEEKAKAYNKVREKIALRFGSNVAEEIFSEFEMSEDEKIRKELIKHLKEGVEGYMPAGGSEDYARWLAWLEKQKEYESTDFEYVWDRTDCDDLTSALDKYSEEAIINMCHAWYDKGVELERKAWLEKQGEHLENHDDEDILQRFSFYSYKDEPNIIYLSGLYVNAEHQNKGIGTKILSIADKVAVRMGCNVIRLKTEIGSNAERLYRRNGYNTFQIEGNQVWLEKQGKHTDKAEPKFEIGDEIKTKNEDPLTITKINEQGYWSGDLFICSFEDSAKWELVGKRINKLEPKFHEGDWVVFNNHHDSVYQIEKIENYEYTLRYFLGGSMSLPFSHENMIRAWTLDDAEDGDILATSAGVFIYNGNNGGGSCPGSYCGINTLGRFQTGAETHWTGKPVFPATKSQRDTLFAKMKEAGCELSEKTHELKKIEQKPIIEMKSAEESLGISSEEYNDIVNECLYGESESSDKVELKFKVGDWITNGDYTWKIIEVKPLDYILQSQDGNIVDDTISHVDEQFHSFTIKDAKDGDVLVASDESVFIYSGSTNIYAQFYIALSKYGDLNTKGGNWEDKNSVHPATKEQRDTLMKAMADGGYTFDFEKKELKEIEPKHEDETTSAIKNEEAYKIGFIDGEAHAKEEMELSWSEEDISNIQYIDSVLFYDKDLPEETCMRLRNWLQSLKPNKDMVEALRTEYEKGKADGIAEMKKYIDIMDKDNIDDFAYQCAYDLSKDWLYENASWDDVQIACKLGAKWYEDHHKVQWSEEDETNLTNTIIMLKEGASHHFTNSSITPCVDWLKQLKQRIGG